MSDRQTPESRLHAMTDLHASIVRADGSVGEIDPQPIPGWQNHDGSAARGAQYRDDQPAGVDNSQQAAQGCRVAAGASGRRADTCTLGTADSSKLRPVVWGLAYGGSWDGEILSSELCLSKNMPPNPKVRVPVHTYTGGDDIQRYSPPERYDLRKASWVDAELSPRQMEIAWCFCIAGSPHPSGETILADARSRGLTVFRTIGTR